MNKQMITKVGIIIFITILSFIFINNTYKQNNMLTAKEFYNTVSVYGSGKYSDNTKIDHQIVTTSLYNTKDINFNFVDVDELNNIYLTLKLSDLEPERDYSVLLNFEFYDNLDNIKSLEIGSISYEPILETTNVLATTNITLLDQFGNTQSKQLLLNSAQNNYQVQFNLLSNATSEAWIVIKINSDNAEELDFNFSNMSIKYSEV